MKQIFVKGQWRWLISGIQYGDDLWTVNHDENVHLVLETRGKTRHISKEVSGRESYLVL